MYLGSNLLSATIHRPTYVTLLLGMSRVPGKGLLQSYLGKDSAEHRELLVALHVSTEYSVCT
jgi:hypothetical protein